MNLFGKDENSSPDEMQKVLQPNSYGSTPASANGGAQVTSASQIPELERTMAQIGKSITIKGELGGNEDLLIEGTVDGIINLPNNELTVGEHGVVRANVHAKSVIVIGKITGNASATERVEIKTSGCVEGDVRGPRLVIQEGASLNGSVEMAEEKGIRRREATADEASTAP